jgi:hypothetical protein
MIPLAKFLYNLDNINSIPNKLKERVFLKTELDVVYSDLSNWERMDLLYLKEEDDKGSWKKLNYIEYTWVCMVSELLAFGYSYAEIKLFKNSLFHVSIGYEQVVEMIRQSDQNDSYVQAIILEIEEIESNPKLKAKKAKYTFSALELAITEIIFTGDDYHYYFFKNGDFLFIPWSKNAITAYELHANYKTIIAAVRTSHFALSLHGIVSRFLLREGTENPQISPSILTKEEYTVLKTIRKDYKNIKSINILFANGRMDRIEITTSKKVKVESRIIDHIKKGDYQKITIDTQDGKMVNFENTQKIKL